MKVLLTLLLIGAAHSFQPTLEHFQIWSQQHSKDYSGEGEEALRMLVWLDNAEYVNELNAQNTGVTYHLNQFGDLTHEEYLQLLSPVSEEQIARVKGRQTLYSLAPWMDVPDTVDWREQDVVTPVKNQGGCGSCYSFSTTGALEGACARKTKKLVSLSEQQVMDCSWQYGNNGCNGGMFDRAFQYIIDNGGLDTEASYPYKGVDSHTCNYDASKVGGTVSKFYYVKQGDEDALKQAIATVGPVAIAINAGKRDFQFYHSGVYDNPACDQTLDHGVLVVGYGTDKDVGKDYFLVKNSWGEQWGLGGYIKMRRNRDNQCGIATYPVIPFC